MGGAVRSAVTAEGNCGALAPDSSGIGVLRLSSWVRRYSLSIIGPLCSARMPRLTVRRGLILKSSWMKTAPYETLGCWIGMVWAVEELSIAPSRKVAQPLPETAVLGERYVFAVC